MPDVADHPSGSNENNSWADLTTREKTDRLIDKSDGNKIYPLTFPTPGASPSLIENLADNIRSSGEQVDETGEDIKASWAGLTGCYQAPHQEELYEVLDPVATDGNKVRIGTNRAARALEDFASTLESIQSRWNTLITDSYEFRARVADEGDEWRDAEGIKGFFGIGESGAVEENNALVRRGSNLIDEYEEAERDCANLINLGVENRTRFEGAPADGELDDDVFYHGHEDDLSDLVTEWGVEATTDEHWWVDAGTAAWDFGVGAVEGLGGALGMHSSEGWFNMSWGDAMLEYHEDNLQSALGLVGLYDEESGYGWSGWDSVGESWKDLAHSVVPWEEWGERPWYVIGTAALNIGATVGGAVLSATGVGATVGVPLMAWRGAAMLDGMGGRGGSGGDGADLDVDLPSTTTQVSTEHMQVIKSYMDQLVNPNYVDVDTGVGDGLGGELTEAGGGRTGTQNTQQHENTSTSPSPRRTEGTEEQTDPRTEELQAFEEAMRNEPDLQQNMKDAEPAFKEHDPVQIEFGDEVWDADFGSGVPVGADGFDPSNNSAGAEAPVGESRHNLTNAEDPTSIAHRDGATAVADRPPVTVMNHDTGGSGHNHTHDSTADGGDSRSGSDDRTGADRTSSSSGDLSGRGTGAPPVSPTGDTGGPPPGQGPGQDYPDGVGDRGSQDGQASRDNGDNQGNPWDREWNNDKLDNRYRPPVVPPERTHTLKEGDSGPPPFPGEGERFAVDQRLEPNSVWDVEGRGRFFTDDQGSISHIDTHPGNKNDTNPELREPRSDMKYAVDVIEHPGKKYHYETDVESRTTHAHGDLQRLKPDEEGGRSLQKKNEYYRTSDQTEVGHEGKNTYTKEDPKFNFEQWDGGHFFGTGFGGSGHRLNLYAQLREVNQLRKNSDPGNNFYQLEKRWRELLDDNNQVRVSFDAEYTGKNKVPTKVSVSFSVNGKPPQTIEYVNTPEPKSDSPTRRKFQERFPATGTAIAGAALMHAGMENSTETGDNSAEERPSQEKRA